MFESFHLQQKGFELPIDAFAKPRMTCEYEAKRALIFIASTISVKDLIIHENVVLQSKSKLQSL